MTTTHVTLMECIEATHRTLEDRLATASAMTRTPGEPRKGYEHIDTLLNAAARHLNAIDQVLLSQVRRSVPDGRRIIRSYLQVARGLEIALAQTKAREYRAAYAVHRSWNDLWSDVRSQLTAQHAAERALVEALSEHVDGDELDRIAEDLKRAEVTATTRAHPFAPHAGIAGGVARRVLHAVDSFWDVAEGRMAPAPHRPAKPAPGLIGQYFMADPRFDEEEPERR